MATAMAELLPVQSVCRSTMPSAAKTYSVSSSFFRGGRRRRSSKLVANGAGQRSKKQFLVITKAALPETLLFDCDGVLVDTERDGHRLCFNKAFEEQRVQVHWDVEFFGTILDLGIGKKRITNYYNAVGWPENVVESQWEDFVAGLHKRKTDLFIDLVESGQLALRPGVATLIDEALANGVQVAVCSSSLKRPVSAIVRVLLDSEQLATLSLRRILTL